MFTLNRLIGSSLFVFVLAGMALAQESRTPIDTPREPVTAAPKEPVAPAGPVVTAVASAKRVRFVSPGTVVQLRLEVFNQVGQKLFDTEQRGGNVLDWPLQDGAGERLQAGSYACVLTIKSLSGRISQRVGVVTVDDEKAAIESAGMDKFSMAQQQAIGPVASPAEGSAGFTVLQSSESEALTTVTHDGTKGQVSRTNGPLSFRVGDIFSGKDKEQMRITEDGSVGIGTSDPQAKLDVAGTIRAERVVIAKPRQPGGAGSDNQTTAADSAQAPDPEQPLATGSGTVNRVAKWTETGGAGTLGDTQITESNGHVVVGNPSNTGNIQIYGTALQDVFSGMGTDINVGPAFNYGYAGGTFGRSAGFFNVRPDVSAIPPNPSLRFMTANVQRMIVTNIGNVGIGTSNPGVRLDVAGDTRVLANLTVDTNTLFVDAAYHRVGIGTATPGRALDVNTSGGGGIRISNTGNLYFRSWDPTTADIRAVGLDSANNLIFGGVGNTGHLIFTGASSERMRIDFLGNVGIGTAAPSARLEVAGNVKISANLTVATNALSVDATNTRVGIGTSSPQAPLHLQRDADIGNWQNAQLRISGTTDANMQLNLGYDTTNNRGVVQAGQHSIGFTDLALNPFGGNVGIGTTAPQRKLHISDAMRLQPIATPPTSPASGDLYFDSSEALCVYVNGAWAVLAGSGTCQ